jgi:DNA-binding transcriptional ArsR family regulator
VRSAHFGEWQAPTPRKARQRRECTVRELEEVTGMRPSLVSYQLQELRKAGLVTALLRGRSNRYRLARGDLDELATLIGTLEPGND